MGAIYKNSIRWWLMALLIIIPFVTRICELLKPWNLKVVAIINRLDEMTVVILLPLALFEFYKDYREKKEIEPLSLLLFFSIVLVAGCGILSGVLNGNALIVTSLGTFSYVKYFLFIFIYAAFFRDFNKFMALFKVILVVGVVIGLGAFIQESWVIFSTLFPAGGGPYKDIYVLISGLLGVSDISVVGSGWRLGIYRATSFLSHYNLLGLHSLLILTIYLYTTKRLSPLILFALISGVLASVSRTVYMGFLLLGGLQVFKARRWFIAILIPVVIALFFMGRAGDNIDTTKHMNEEMKGVEYQQVLTYRAYAREKALKVWGDHPIIGVGPGMFGGAIAYKFNSFYYQEYNFPMIMSWFHSLDQLWPQVLAEMGLIGTGALAGLFITLFVVFYTLGQSTDSDEKRRFFRGMMVFSVIFLFYTFAGNLNIVSILLPFCAFTGIGLGCERLQVMKDIEIEKVNN